MLIWVIANMNLKIAILILILLALAWPSYGLDSLYLGSGLRDQVINLDAGARLPGQSYNFAATRLRRAQDVSDHGPEPEYYGNSSQEDNG